MNRRVLIFLLLGGWIGLGSSQVSAATLYGQPALGTKKVQYVSVDYANTNNGWPTTSELQDLASDIQSHYREMSYGKFNLIALGFSALKLNIDRDDTCQPTQIVSEFIRQNDASIDFRPYTKRLLLFVVPFPDYYSGETTSETCHWSGISTLRTYQTNDGRLTLRAAFVRAPAADQPVDRYVAAHELGHLLDSNHANWLACPDGETFDSETSCQIGTSDEIEYEDPFDTMGGLHKATGQHLSHFNAPRKEWRGWLDSENILSVQLGDAAQSVTLMPIEWPGDGIKAIKIERAPGDYMYLEYRQPTMADGSLNADGRAFSSSLPSIFEGAMFHLSPLESGRTILLDAYPVPTNSNTDPVLRASQTLADPETGASLTIRSKNAAGLVVEVTAPARLLFQMQLLSPKPGQLIGKDGRIVMNSADDLSKVMFSINDTPLGQDRAAPYTHTFSTAWLSNGTHTAKVFATGLRSIRGDREVIFTVRNRYAVRIAALKNNQSISSRMVALKAEVFGTSKVRMIEYFVDGKRIATTTKQPHTIYIYTRTLSPGTHRFSVRATSLRGTVVNYSVSVRIVR